ncbi:unnamed protein product [Didymodactylos carnosus]|uniref:Endonuclease/exonuclease/phosphatase domain-containing protein n=1 Tax=Didymodactylos carnosus TaxID=1234261 RepID=A0A8S2CTF6_9BILA|nr:unnamed protein product [Didymodactylos carnosus]CAF3582342.1 unnamed protein product [Didymodactylos carnosus]
MSGTQGTGEKWATGQTKKEKRNKPKLTTPKSEIQIAAWNVRTAHNVGQKEIIAKELLNHKISIAALSELRLTGSGTTTVEPPITDEKMTLFYSGGEKREAGVGFMVDKRAASSIVAFQPISDRLAILPVAGTIKTHVISVYAPTETSQDQAKDDFYDHLQHALDLIPRIEVIMLAGNFNAHIGTARIGWEGTMGKFGHGEINDNGLRLLSFAAANDLIFGNSWFQHSTKQPYQIACAIDSQ